MVGILISFWGCLFSGVMLVLGSVALFPPLAGFYFDPRPLGDAGDPQKVT